MEHESRIKALEQDGNTGQRREPVKFKSSILAAKSQSVSEMLHKRLSHVVAKLPAADKKPAAQKGLKCLIITCEALSTFTRVVKTCVSTSTFLDARGAYKEAGRRDRRPGQPVESDELEKQQLEARIRSVGTKLEQTVLGRLKVLLDEERDKLLDELAEKAHQAGATEAEGLCHFIWVS